MKKTVEFSAEPVTKGFYSPQDLATWLDISTATVYRMAYKRLLPAYKINGVLRFDREEVKKFIQAGRIGPMFLV